MKFGLSKNERLKNKKDLERIFAAGRRLRVGQVSLFYLPAPERKAAFVTSRRCKKAVERNRIKRFLREAYRLNKNLFGRFYMVFYAGGLLKFSAAASNVAELGRILNEKNSSNTN